MPASTTALRIEVSTRSVVRVDVYEVLGRIVDRWDVGQLAPGPHELRWGDRARRRRLPAGIYFGRVVVRGEHLAQQRMVHLP